MKKRFLALLMIIASLLMMASCASGGALNKEYDVSLEKNPVVLDGGYQTNGELTIHFEVPEDGYFNIMAYDATEYEEDMGEYPEPYATLSDEKGNVLYQDLPIADGMQERCRLSKGSLTAKISFKGAKKMDRAGLYWSFGADVEDAIALKEGEYSAAKSSNAGKSRFTFEAEQAGLYSITCAEGSVWESDCTFEVFNEAEESVAGVLMIHGTEWGSRSVFLQKGKHEIVVSEIKKVAICKVEAAAGSDGLVTAGSAPCKVPAAIGFNLANPQSQIATFEVGDHTRLWVDANGSNAYYDSEQGFNLLVKNESGNVIAEERAEGTAMVDLKGQTGEITVEISGVGNGLVYLNLE